MLVSVITPTFNRSENLCQLFQSLENQNDFDFEWIIIDDGSNDDTKNVVNSFIKAAKFQILYKYQRNAGKHIALNNGISCASGEIAVILDSDDLATPDMMENIKKEWTENRKLKLALIVFERATPDGEPLRSLSKVNGQSGNYNHLKYKYKLTGDYAETYNLDILKKFSFPKFGDEKFLSEDFVWIDLGKDNDALFIARPLMITEYLSGGLTKRSHKLMWENPIGAYQLSKKRLTVVKSIRARYKALIVYAICGIKIGVPLRKLIAESKSNKLMSLIVVMIAVFFQPILRKL